MKKSMLVIVLSCGVLGLSTVAGIFALINWELNTTEEGISGIFDPSTRLQIHLASGENYYEAHLYQFAEAEFKRAQIASEKSKYMTDRGEAYTRLGQTAMKQNKPDEALAYLREAHEYYEKAEKDEFVFKMERRVHAKGLGIYEKLLRQKGDHKEADLVASELKELTEELGTVEKFRGMFSDL